MKMHEIILLAIRVLGILWCLYLLPENTEPFETVYLVTSLL